MSTIFNTKCLPGLASSAPTRVLRGPARAHTPPRRPAQFAPDAPRLTASLLEYHEGPAVAAEPAPEPLVLTPGCPRVLHVDPDVATAGILSTLVVPEASVVHAATLSQARLLLQSQVFSLVVIDPALPDGDARTLIPLLGGTPLLVYSAHQPEWHGTAAAFLPKPWTSARQLWSTIAGMLGMAPGLTAGD